MERLIIGQRIKISYYYSHSLVLIKDPRFEMYGWTRFYDHVSEGTRSKLRDFEMKFLDKLLNNNIKIYGGSIT